MISRPLQHDKAIDAMGNYFPPPPWGRPGGGLCERPPRFGPPPKLPPKGRGKRLAHRATALPSFLAILLLVTLATLSGCEAVSFFAQAFAKKTDAVYKLEDRPTLVLVDDPTAQLGDPALEATIANQVGFELTQSKTVKQMISADKTTELAGRLGPQYSSTPMDRIGREVGAAQIIGIYIESVEANADEEAYRPVLRARVKVIDANGKRLFPPADAAAAGDDMTATRGQLVETTLFYRTTTNGRGDVPIVIHKLIEKTGRNIAWLFYKHTERQPGEKFED